MRRRPIFFSVFLGCVVLLLGWLVVRSVPAAERARLEAAYQADVERWGNPDEWEWVRPPIIGPVVEGTAVEWYAKARAWLEEDRGGDLVGGLLPYGHQLRLRMLNWVMGEEPAYYAKRVADVRPALDLIERGARTPRSGTALEFRSAVLVYGPFYDQWVEDVVALGGADAVLLALRGEHARAVDRVLATLRMAEDLARCGVCNHERPAVRALSTLAEFCQLPIEEERRLANALSTSLQTAQSAPLVVGRQGLLAQREHRALHLGISTLRPLVSTAYERDDPVLAVLDEATGLGFLPSETLGAWMRTQRCFVRLRRSASREDDAQLMASVRKNRFRPPDEEAVGLVEKVHGVWLPGRNLEAVEDSIRCRIEKEAVLYGLRLRDEWRRTGRRPSDLSRLLPPGVRERPGGRPWLLRPTEGGGLDLVWSGDRGDSPISFYIHPPRDPR